MVKTSRQEQKEATCRKIIDAAFAIYADNGFSTPTNAIAQKAELSHGSIFVHFPNKDALQLAVMERFAEEIGDQLHHLSVGDSTLEQLLYAHIRILEGYEAFYTNVIAEQSRLPSATKTLLISVHSIMSHHLGVVAEREKRCGAIKDIPVHMLFHTWMGLVHYYLQNGELFAPGTSVLKRCKNELVETYLKLIEV